MAKLAASINKDNLRMDRKKKSKDQLLYELQDKYQELYGKLLAALSKKKGSVRMTFGGRWNFTARSVIVPGPHLGVDEITLSYQCLATLYQQTIINILHKSYNMSYDNAYKFLMNNMYEAEPTIVQIINGLIRDVGLAVLINRNPTISFGGILCMHVVGIAEGFTMAIPLQIIKGLAADFDGDTLNIMAIINDEFREAAELVFNPRNSMYVSMNDGMFNSDMNHQRDTIVNANAITQITRCKYTPAMLKKIQDAKAQKFRFLSSHMND
jgi:DNA-directed RNA polymerase beta' subunit